MANENDFYELQDDLTDQMDLDDLEAKLYSDLDSELDEDFSKLELLKDQQAKIGNPDALGDVIKNVIWQQFQNQIGVQAGEDFITENRGMTLDLRNSAHIQTAENFANGNIATHNYISKEQLEENYNRYKNVPHKQFRKEYVNPGMDETLERAGELNRRGVETVRDIYTGREIPTAKKLENGKDNPKAAQREHVKASGQLYQNASLQMANDNEELANIINDPENLQGYTTAERNNRKNDKTSDEMDERDKNEHWKKANERAEKFIKEKEKQGEERLIKEGRKTQKEEAFRIGKSAAKAVVMQLLADFVKEVVSKLVKWFKSKNKKFRTLIDSIKEAIHSFIGNLKTKLINVGSNVVTTIGTAIFGPIVNTLKRIWMFLKQGWRSLKQAINYLRSPEAKEAPFEIVMLQVGKIIIGALTAGGAIVLGEVIEKGLMHIPIFNIPIPLLGSLANILGIFLGAVIAGIVGAIALNLIDKAIAKKQKLELQTKIIRQTEVVIKGQTLQTWEKLGAAYETVGKITEKTVESIRNSVQKERDSLNDVDDVLNEIDAIIGK